MEQPQKITCKELVELVTDYLENALSERDLKCFENHINGCSGCRAYLDQMRKTIQVAGKLSEDNIEPAARDELLDVFRNWKNT